ncbi:MAG TPA: diguanylate cyclase [Gemmataceae bacterium]|nr:diguanylate cyclase [Gemmataceae bacterium]
MAILIVDDQRDMRESLKFLLEAQGHSDVRLASNGRDALELLTPDGPVAGVSVDVLVIDVMMPGLSGIEVCRQIKGDPRLHDIPVLVMTGRSDESLLEQAFAAGAHDFLPKPVSPNELTARVRAAIRLKQELDQRRAHERELIDMTDRLKRLNDQLKRLAVLDDLTGVPNRRFFNQLVRKEWGRAAREETPLSLILIDVDVFKAYNDRYGHPAGDACLARVAGALNRVTRRPGDAIARYGGEEFAVLLANTAADGAAVVAEKLRGAVEGLGLEHFESAHRVVTISLGVATAVPNRRGSPDRLMGAADRALYEAKAGGRNRVGIAATVDAARQAG